MKPKIFVATKNVQNPDTLDMRTIVIVGKWVKGKNKEVKSIVHGNGKLLWEVSTPKYTLTLGKAICHPEDKFDLDTGVQLALRRIDDGNDIGQLSTEDYTMLTPDNCQLIVQHKADYIGENIVKFIGKEN